MISCGARLAPFDIKELRDLMEYDEMELDTLGDRKTALFLIMSDTDSTFNFVIAILQSQLFNLLCDKADDVYGGRLPVHVRCILDEFANIGQIPQFDKLIATIRSREISASIILQSQSQLKAIYKDNADKGVAAHPGNNAEGNAVKQNDMSEEKPDDRADQPDHNTDCQNCALCCKITHTYASFFELHYSRISKYRCTFGCTLNCCAYCKSL